MDAELREAVARALAQSDGLNREMQDQLVWDDGWEEQRPRWHCYLDSADAAIAAVKEAVKDELCRHAYRTGWRDAVEEYHVSGEPPRKGCAAEGYQNWLANEPALSAFKGTDK